VKHERCRRVLETQAEGLCKSNSLYLEIRDGVGRRGEGNRKRGGEKLT
jgi:hypothetical protein